jgi:deoxyribose-phosphate aldolase
MNNKSPYLKDNHGMVIRPGTKVTSLEIAKMIDHSLLKPEMARTDVVTGCLLASKYKCATVCVKPCDVAIAYDILKNTDVLVSTVVGFPHGSNLTEVKLLEAELAIKQGCKELDMVLNIGLLKSGDYELIREDISAIRKLAHKHHVLIKVIFENYYLTDEEIKIACEISEKAGADFIKTSTGYAGGGATVKDLILMRASTSLKVHIKAAGGVRSLDSALAVRALGCTRFGATATKAIIEEARKREHDGTLVIPDAVTELSIG